MKNSSNIIFRLKKEVYKQMVEHCKNEIPLEACGLISGKNLMGLSCWPVPNEEKSSVRFAISEDVLKDTFNNMKKKGERLTGIFHSHPTTRAYPSFYDIKNHTYPNVVYIIISLVKKEPVVNCFLIHKNREVTKLSLKLV
ncbi:Mov34/MPN/PAD-1 family protein [Alkalihalobacterium sp. APHAB7]|uniref:Mov34/MPN/PAD-1 family protein n=1 Tax=Alkalihalobacterium sp. APHAB7 TaxID=3402081 RepID=UPI003AADEAD1